MKIFISGYGKMGKKVEEVLTEKNIECIGKSNEVQSIDKELIKDSICIDFTTPSAFKENYKFLADNFRAVILGTTGWEDIKEDVFSYFKFRRTTLIWASNFSIGVNVFTAAVDQISKRLGSAGGYSPYLVDKHHVHKLDAPSGTAKMLASIVDENMQNKTEISSLRIGELAGTHTVGFEGLSDRITIEHEAFDRKIFAEGAVFSTSFVDNVSGIHEFRNLLQL